MAINRNILLGLAVLVLCGIGLLVSTLGSRESEMSSAQDDFYAKLQREGVRMPTPEDVRQRQRQAIALEANSEQLDAWYGQSASAAASASEAAAPDAAATEEQPAMPKFGQPMLDPSRSGPAGTAASPSQP